MSQSPGDRITNDCHPGFCEAEGRDHDAIEKTGIYHFRLGDGGSTSGQLVKELRGLAAKGIQTVIGIVAGPDPVRTVEIVGREVIPAVVDA